MPRVTNRSISVVPISLDTAALRRTRIRAIGARSSTEGTAASSTVVATGVLADNFATLAQPVTAVTTTPTVGGHLASANIHPFHPLLRIPIDFDLVVLLLPRPRSEIKVPISPSEKITANTIFTDPDTSTGKKYYIPSFTLVEQVLDGTRRFRATMRQVEGGWLLTVIIASDARSGGTEAIQTSFTPLLRFTKPTASGVTKELPLAREQEDETTWKASLYMGGLNERDEVFHALTKLEYQTQFILRCRFKAALPVPKKESDDEQLYMPGSHAVDIALNRDPFIFDPQQHPHIFEGITNVSNRTFDLILRQVEWQGRIHHYYQDEASPYVFYYLPDAFKVTRKPELPYTPNMRIKFTSEDGSLEKMRASLEYVAAPVVNPERLENAADKLKEHLPSPMPTGITGAVFQPLVVNAVEQLRLTLALPRAGASGTPRQERPGVVSNLTDSLKDEIADLTMSNFQDVFDALFGKSAVVFSGEVFVGGGGQRPDAVVPFVARLDNLHGPILEEVETPNADGTVGLTVRNGCESPVTVRSIPLEIIADGKVLAAHAENLTRDGEPVAFPVELAPDQTLALTVVPDQPSAVSGTPEAVFNLDGVEIQSDPEAVWAAILDASVPAEYTRTIKVMAFAEWFAPTTDVLAIAVDFENGDSVVLRANNLEAEGHVRVPVSDLVLRKVQESEYRYTQITVRQSGQTRTQKSDSLDLLFPEVTS